MNYQRIYDQIIERARTRQLEGYVEKHHIVPRCLGGTNNTENIVQLTAREIYWKKHILESVGWEQVLFCELYDRGGGPKSEQTRLKTSLSLKGKPMVNNMKKVEKYSFNNILIEEFNSQIEAAASVNSKQSAAISECCKNKRKSYKGFIWKYKEK